MRVLKLDAERGLALCEAPDGRRHTVEVALVQRPAQGDTLLVHAGVAIAGGAIAGGAMAAGGEPA
jgi:hydrogenase maturation factor